MANLLPNIFQMISSYSISLHMFIFSHCFHLFTGLFFTECFHLSICLFFTDYFYIFTCLFFTECFYSEWTLKPYRCIIKNITPENTRRILENLRINTCCKNRKKFAWEINSGVIKMYGACPGKRICLKKEIKEFEITEHACSRKYACFTKGTFHFR